MPFIFLDESGQFKKTGSEKYFVIAAFTTGDHKRASKSFRTFQHKKFPRKLRNQTEIKFADTKSESLRSKMLSNISNMDVRVRYSYFLIDDIPANYREGLKIKSGALYLHAVLETLESFLPIADKELRVFCDKRHLKGISQTEYKRIITENLSNRVSKDVKVQVEVLDSTQNENMQIVDWIAGALSAYHNRKIGGSDYFVLLRNNLIGEGKMLFRSDV